MSNIATYTFLPWMRQGLANEITGQSGQRATIPVTITPRGSGVGGGTVNGAPVHHDVQIYGPGDIAGLDVRAIIKNEPRHWITNFEPNYLPYVDFYDEDLPWRYSPVTPQNHRLLPWIALIVLKDGEFTDGKNIKDRPLPYILTNAQTRLQPPAQLWAWAHVHMNRNLIGSAFLSTDSGAIQAKLASELNADPDRGYSRLIAPRRLEANNGYHAFVVPAFESGRLAGLGQDPAGAASFDTPAWTDSSVPTEIPVYHRWYFRTGEIGDFEYLVRLLKPQPIDSRVGLRDMDVQRPGANIRGIIDAATATDEERLHGILKLGGALKIPDIFYDDDELAIVRKYENWSTLNGLRAYPHPFQTDVAAFINLTDDYEHESAAQANADSGITEEQAADDPATEYEIGRNPDPLITAPLYGRWHALTKRLLVDRDGNDLNPNDNWVHDLNLDPRWRTAAGFGTGVVQDNQEDYITAAWEQVGEVLESNKLIRYAQVAKEVSFTLQQTHINPMQQNQPAQWLAVSAPLHARIMTTADAATTGAVGGDRAANRDRRTTLRHQIATTTLPRAAFSTGMRKQLRARGQLVKRLPFDDRVTPLNVAERINAGEVSAAPPRARPPALDALEEAAEAARPDDIPPFIADLLIDMPALRWLPIVLLVLLLLLLLVLGAGVVGWSLGLLLAAGLVFAWRVLSNWSRRLGAASSVLPENQEPGDVDDWPTSPDFALSLDGDIVRPTFTVGGQDSEEGTRFKAAIRDAFTLVRDHVVATRPVPRPRLDITATSGIVFEALDPEVTIPKWTFGRVTIPGRIRDQLQEAFVEAMAYPEIDLPMYKPLTRKSSELFLPNIHHIAQNSISLLETNQPFIESYMVGLNHEFARELLWREYPTDQRGSYFRQFWEARGYHDDGNLSADALKEKLYDIPRLHLWSRFNDLGDHDNREEGSDNEEEVVLVIRGELLKRYPNAVIYAQRAVWRDAAGDAILDTSGSQVIDVTKERDLRPLTEAEQQKPPREFLKTPLYEAQVAPDIYFFGFDLTVCEAVGGTGREQDPVDEICAAEGITWDDPGWFFVIKERPGEPRFGLDIGDGGTDAQNRVEVWNDLAWADITPAVTGGGFLQINNQTTTITADQPTEADDLEKLEQKGEDENILWHANMSSAELAYILYQVPVLVGVHATEMLPRN
ncbi:MAG: hypothetical protein ACREQ8_18035 [Woeseiaceae bacterium]